MSASAETKICGKYRHYKGENYDVYSDAFDLEGNRFVLYQQCYGDKSFWIRPYDMFFDTVDIDGERKERFVRTNSRNKKCIEQLINMARQQIISVRHSETKQRYTITSIEESTKQVIVCQADCNASGYLTDYEIIKRLGYDACCINGELTFFAAKEKIDERKVLRIGDNDINSLERYINPCSIDLQIAMVEFLRAKLKHIDPQSIEHISVATKLWKSVKKHKSRDGVCDYIRIYPGETILTHTKEKIKIPNDCAGKIEIKSTFARLSLSVTFGDFCNPGYYGFFPLEIKNNGKHIIVIHAGETMLQLMLIPLHGQILRSYTNNATYSNSEGYDDGTP